MESPAALLAWAHENDIVEIDMRFVDIRGIPQHFSMPIQSVDEGSFEDGFGFDGSSIQGFQAINESDMILLADLATAYVDPFFGYKTLALSCDAHDPISREPYSLDARGVAKRAEAYLNNSDLADVAYFGPEAEFFMFDNVQYSTSENSSFYRVDSFEGDWNSGNEDPAQGHMNRIKMGYFPLSPLDKTQDVRAEMVQTMLDVGMEVEVACRYGMPITFVVINNNGIGGGVSEYIPGKPLPTSTYTLGARYERVIEAFGGKGYLVEKVADLGPTLDKALASDRPALVNVLIDPKASRKPQKFAWLTR